MKQLFSKIATSWGRNASFIATGTLAGVLMLILSAIQPPVLRQIDLKLYDYFLAKVAEKGHLDATVIVDVDEVSLSACGQWPWPRYRLANLVERLLDAGAVSVVLDILLAEPDRTSVSAILRDLDVTMGVKAKIENLPDFLQDNDRLLAETLRNKPVVLGAYLTFAEGAGQNRGDKGGSPDTAKALPTGIKSTERSRPGADPVRKRLLRAEGMVAPVSILSDVADVGFFNAALDQDGLVRRIPVLAQVGDKLYPNLGLRALMQAVGARSLRLTAGTDGLESIGVGKFTFSVSPAGNMLVPFLGPARTFPYISAIDILEGRFEPEQVKGKIVLVGSSAPGLMDIRATPFDRYTPGVEMHANMVDAVLSGRFINVPPWETGLQLVVVILISLLSVPLFSKLPPLLGVSGGVLLIGCAYAGAWNLFSRGLWVTPLWAMSTLAVEASVLTVLRFFLAERDRRRLRNVFSRYVSPEVVSRIADRGETVLRGEQRELSVMFTDLRGFTSISEKLKPEQVVGLLNRYFTPMTGLVRGSRGTLDKFIGDALMAFWNAPLDVPDHPRLAVTTALSMLDALDVFNKELQRELGLQLGMGAGIHTGPAYVGNMGSRDLTSYTAIGDTVNLASRMEGLCKIYGVSLVLSGETAAHCGDDVCLLPLARLRVRGRREPVDVFTAMRPQEAVEKAAQIRLWRESVLLFRSATSQGDRALLAQCAENFAELNHQKPEPLSQAYIDSCAALSVQKPEEWTDVWTMTDK